MKRLAEGYEAELDEVLERAIHHRALNIPGLVAMCRRGDTIYGPKAFGFADLESRRLMQSDAMMRMYSMTKVLTSTIALILYDRGLLKLNDPVGDYIPEFDRAWSVVRSADKGDVAYRGEVEVANLLLGTKSLVGYAAEPAREPMRIKHLMSETSGIGYDVWGDLDEVAGGVLGTNGAFHIANALRSRLNDCVYKSSCILGQNLDLEQFCRVIAEAGVLSTHPGQLSYGLGATVLGRVIEVVDGRKRGRNRALSDIFREMLFDPIGMSDAAFFLADGDVRADRIPTLYGVSTENPDQRTIVPAAQSVPPTNPTYSNGTDHTQGPRKQESGDTGTLMTVADFGKFLDFLAAGGVTENGERLLAPASHAMLTSHWVAGLDLDTGLARAMELAGRNNQTLPASFQFGWAVTQSGDDVVEYGPTDHPARCYWGGYARTSMNFYREEDSWIVLAPQIICHHPAATVAVVEALTDPVVSRFVQLWR
jgi:CubicO group peptidase (beta-lactamase class C family)